MDLSRILTHPISVLFPLLPFSCWLLVQLCYAGSVYSRLVDRQEFTFGVSPKLLMNVQIMYAGETSSLWSQLLGEAAEGDLREPDWSSFRRGRPSGGIGRIGIPKHDCLLQQNSLSSPS